MRVYSKKITVTAAGTPKPVWNVATEGVAPRVTKIRIIPTPGNTKAAYVGCTSDFNRSTGVGYIDQATATQPFIVESHDANTLPLDEYFIDAEVNGEGAVVSYWVA